MKNSPLKSPFVAVLLPTFVLLLGIVCSAANFGLAQTTKNRDGASDLNAQNPFAARTARDAATSNAAPLTPTTKIVPRNKPTDSSVPDSAPNVASALAADVLLLKKGEFFVGSVEKISGRDGVLFRVSAQEKTRRFSTSDVERIETPVGPEFQQGVSAFERGLRSGGSADFRRALAAFQAARQSETRRWIREWATAKIVESLVALGRSDEAANEFFLLAQLDPYSAFLSSIPLRWSNRTSFERAFVGSLAESTAKTDNSQESAAALWLDKKNPLGAQNPVGRLLAASILLNSAKYKNDAISALQDLVVCTPPKTDAPDAKTNANAVPTADVDAAQTCQIISLLATAQLWRLSFLKTPTEREVDRWEKTLALFPNELRLGPTFLVARADVALGRDDAARRAFLQVALLATSNRELAEQAAKSAAESLERAGQSADAERLRADVSARFAK